MNEEFKERRQGSLDLHNRVIAIESAMVEMKTSLAKNNAATNDILDIVTTAKGFFKVLGVFGDVAKWVSGIVVTCAAAWAIFKGWKS